MSCFTVRLDDKDNNTVLTQFVAPPMYPGTGTKLYVAWAERGDPAGSTSHNRAVKFNWFDGSDHSVGSVVTIQAYDATKDMDYIDARILSNGTMLVAYGANGPRVKESTDSGATWPTSADPAGTFGAATGVPALAGLITDGTNVFLAVQQTAGGGGENDVTVYKRNSAGSWAAGVKVHDTPGSNIVPFFNFTGPRQGGSFCGLMFDATHGLIIGDYANTGAPAEYRQVAVLRTTDGWQSAATVIPVATYSANFPRYPSLAMGADGRLRAMWIDNATGKELAVLAYSDDQGLTWTVVGTPTIFSDANWDNSFDRAMWLGRESNIICGAFDAVHYPDVRHFTFFGGDSLSGWTETICTNLAYVVASNTTGNGYVANGNWFRLFNKNSAGVLQVNVLWVENVDTGGGGAPPLEAESPLGTDLPDRYLRLRAAERRGWSAHDLGVACWSLWGEGDYTTERRKRFLIGAAAIIDPTATAPQYLPALWKIDDPERYTREVLADDGTGNTVVSADPFPFEVITRDFEMGTLFGTSLLRGFSLRYIRPAGTFTVEFLVDDRIAYTEVLGPTPLDWYTDVFLPCPTDDNDGSRCRIRIFDPTEYPLILGPIQPKWIDKGIRG